MRGSVRNCDSRERKADKKLAFIWHFFHLLNDGITLEPWLRHAAFLRSFVESQIHDRTLWMWDRLLRNKAEQLPEEIKVSVTRFRSFWTDSELNLWTAQGFPTGVVYRSSIGGKKRTVWWSLWVGQHPQPRLMRYQLRPHRFSLAPISAK